MGGVCAIWVISPGQLEVDPEPSRDVLGGDHHMLGAPQHIDGSQSHE